MRELVVLSCSLVATIAYAGGGAGHATLADLAPPALNFTILFSFLGWKLTPVFRGHFTSKHKEVKETAQRAKTLKHEAQMQLEQQEKKNQTLDKRIEEIKSQAQKEVEQYKAERSKENEEKISKLKQDAESKIEMQKQEYISSLNGELVNLIVKKAKETVKSEGGLKGDIEAKLMQGLK